MKNLLTALLLTITAATPAFAQDYTNQKIQVGQQAPELAFPAPSGETMKLSEIYKGRVVLLDFWASWCGPCRRASPELVAMYNKYKDAKFPKAKNGFTIVSVSLDKSKDAWVGAIAQDGYVWPYHMSDLGGWDSQPAVLYGVQSIPQSMLIGPDGKVIGKYAYGTNPEADIEKLMKGEEKKGKKKKA